MFSMYTASGNMPGIFEWCVLGGLIYWLFNQRVKAMVDVLSVRLQDVYTRWGTASHLRHTERLLYNIKEADGNPLPQSQPRPFPGLSCTSCTPSSRSANVDKDHNNVDMMDILEVEKLSNHPNTFLGKLFPKLTHALSFKKFHFPYIFESVLADEKVKCVIIQSAHQALEDPETDDDEDSPKFKAVLKRQHEKAVKMLVALRSTFSDSILRLASYTMNKVIARLYSRVVVHPAQIEMLRRASATNLPLLFLPLHRSHLDYIIITFILANNNLQSPLVAAGENLRIPVFGWLLRGLGAFFIKRRMNKGMRDIMYRALLQTYMDQALIANHNFEFFIEGGRTRTGKPCMPKGGLLSVIVDAYMDGTVDDALLVPVSINYERIVDGNFVREQTGQPKQMETFSSAVRSIWSCLTSHYGAMRVDFNQPFSLRELVGTFQSKVGSKTSKKKVLHSVPSTASLYGTDVAIEEHRLLVDSIARHIIYDCCRSTAIMSTNAVSFLLLNAFREGTTVEELAGALDRLRDLLYSTHRDCGFVGLSVDVINHAVDILGPGLVRRERSSSGVVIAPITQLPNVIELQYYSNCLLPHFVLEAVIAKSISCLVKEAGAGAVVYRNQIMAKTVELCEVMQYEFIFTKTCQSLDVALSEVLDTFITSGILTTQQKAMLTEEEEWSQRYAKHLENSDDEDDAQTKDDISDSDDLGDEYKVDTNNELQRLYSSLLQPFIDAYVTTAQTLHRLEDRQVPETELLSDILKDMTTRLEIGSLIYNECVSVDSVRSALKLLERWEVVECHLQDVIKLYYLGRQYDNETLLRPVVNRLLQFQ